MEDVASLVLAIDSTQVPRATASLDGLTAAGARAEAATLGFGRGSKTAAAEGAAMAAAAQASARAVMGQAAGFKVATDAARVNTLAMRESLVVARELARGNFTRIPGSLTLLAQGIGSQGGLSAFGSAIAKQLGLVKTLQNAELAEQAVAAESAAAAVESAARRAAANVFAADTEIALAEAQIRVTRGTSAEAAAQVRLAEAHQAVAAAAAEAAVAEDALAVAMGRSTEAGAASAAATTTTVSALGAALGLAAIGGGLLFVALKEAKDAADEIDPSAKQFISTLGLTHREIERLKDTTVTWGDVAHGTFDAIAAAAGVSSSQFKHFWNEAFLETAQVAVSAAQVIAGAFAAASSVANNLKNVGIAVVDPAMAGLLANGVPSPAKIGQDALKAFEKQFSATGKFFNETLPQSVNAARDARLQKQADKLIGDRTPKKPKKESDHGLQEELDKLDAEIKGQYALAAAYQVSDAAAMRATAMQKAEEDAIRHKSSAGVFYEKELQKAVGERVAKGEEAAARLREETGIRKAANDAVAAGTLTLKQATDQMQLQVGLLPLIAAYDNADTAHKAAAAAAIRDYTKAQKDSNAETERTQALQALQSGSDEIARLRLEASLIGKSNSERAVALAQLQAMQQYRDVTDPSQKADLVAQAAEKARLSVQTPFQQWAKDIPQTAAAITDALQSIEFKGFDALASSIAGIVTGTESLGHAFRDISRQIIADIVQMTIKMLIFRAISGIFGGVLGGGSGSNIASVAGARASGGPVSSGRTYIVGERGPELFRPSSSGTIIPNRRMAANNNQSGPIEVHILVDTSENLEAKVDAKIVGGMQQAVAVSVQHTNDTIRTIARPKLSGR